MAAEADSDIAARRRRRRNKVLRRQLGCFSALRRAQDGVSAIEFALASPFLLLLLLPLLDLGQAISEQIRLNLAVQAGTQYASLNLWSSTSSTDIANIVNNATTLSLSSVTATEYCGCPNTGAAPTLYAYPSAPATCGSSYPSCTADSQPAGIYIQVSAQYGHTSFVPYSALPYSNGLQTLTSTAVVRTY